MMARNGALFESLRRQLRDSAETDALHFKRNIEKETAVTLKESPKHTSSKKPSVRKD